MESPPTVLHWRPVGVPTLWSGSRSPVWGSRHSFTRQANPPCYPWLCPLPAVPVPADLGCMDGGPGAADHQPGRLEADFSSGMGIVLRGGGLPGVPRVQVEVKAWGSAGRGWGRVAGCTAGPVAWAGR